MPKYQVTLTYLITVDNAENESHAEWCALYDIGQNPIGYNDIEIEEVDTPKDYGLNAGIVTIDEIFQDNGQLPNNFEAGQTIGLSVKGTETQQSYHSCEIVEDHLKLLKDFKNYLEEHKAQQTKILNALKEKLGETKGD